MDFLVDLFREQWDIWFSTPVFCQNPSVSRWSCMSCLMTKVFAFLMRCVLNSETHTIALDISRLNHKADFQMLPLLLHVPSLISLQRVIYISAAPSSSDLWQFIYFWNWMVTHYKLDIMVFWFFVLYYESYQNCWFSARCRAGVTRLRMICTHLPY